MKYFFVIILLFQMTCLQNTLAPEPARLSDHSARAIAIDGLSFVAPPRGFSGDPMTEVQQIGADWIAVIPYAFTRRGEATVHFNSQRQWWGERPEGIIETIRLANAAGINVMMKPQVYFPGSWPGDLDFENESDWESWEKDYHDYIMSFVPIADSMGVSLFCVGTEFKFSEQKRAPFWRKLIKDIRSQYKGKLTYAANWDCYDKVPFWDDLDYVGIDAYFPLVNEKTPTHKTLVKAWQKHLDNIRSFHKKAKKQILFTEFGYLSVDGCAHNTWELEGQVRELPINEQAQANSLHALFTVFSQEDYWAGGFLWKWFPNMKGHEGYPSADYTPQGKIGEGVVQEWYHK